MYSLKVKEVRNEDQKGENLIFWSLQTHGLYLFECRHGLGQGNSDGVVTIREEGVIQ